MVVTSINELQEALRYALHRNLPYFVLGRGSNCLFDDRGYNGLVIHNKIDFLRHEPQGTFYVGAGYNFSR